MASEPLRYTSQKDAEQAAARLNAKDGGGWVIETRMEADKRTVWYVNQSPPICPVRGVDLSTIPVPPWRSEVSNARDRVKESFRHCMTWLIASLALYWIALAMEHWGYTSISRWLFFPLAACAVIKACWISYQAATIKNKIVGRHLYFKCECGKKIGTDVDWICGECKHKNEKKSGALDSFLVKCEKCSGAPAAFVCYHCGRVTPLIAGGDFRHPAFAAETPEVHQHSDHHSERMAEAERRKQAFEKEIQALEAERKVVLTVKELEDVRNKLCDASSTEFERQMKRIEEFSLGEDAIFAAWAAEAARVKMDSRLDEPSKKLRLDRLSLYAKGLLDKRKVR